MKKFMITALILLMVLSSVASAANISARNPQTAQPRRMTLLNRNTGTQKPPSSANALQLSKLPFVEVEALGITPMNDAYIKRVLKGLNNTRAEFGNSALKLRDDLNYAAQKQAYAMAKRNAMFHSGAPCFEACYVDLYRNTQYAETVGALLAVHCGQMTSDAKMKAFGIGAYKWVDEDGDTMVAICVTASKVDDLSKYNTNTFDWKDNEHWK